MTRPWLPSQPAFLAGESGQQRIDENANPERGAWLSAYLNQRRAHRLKFGPQEPYGYFKALDLFVKVVPPQRGRRLFVADHLAATASKGQLTPFSPALLRDFPKKHHFPDGNVAWILAYPWIDARQPQPGTEDFSRVGEALAKLHRALRTQKISSAAASRSYRRVAALKQTANAWVLKREPGFEIIQKYTHLLDLFYRFDCQQVHGDLNRGNVIVNKQTESVFIIDFETALYTLAPPGFDVAVTLERIPSDTTGLISGTRNSIHSAKEIIKSYQKYSNSNPFNTLNDLPRLTILNSIRALLLLKESEARGSPENNREKEKFLQYIVTAENDWDLLVSLIDECR